MSSLCIVPDLRRININMLLKKKKSFLLFKFVFCHKNAVKTFRVQKKKKTGRPLFLKDSKWTHGCWWTNTADYTTCDLSFTGQCLSFIPAGHPMKQLSTQTPRDTHIYTQTWLAIGLQGCAGQEGNHSL